MAASITATPDYCTHRCEFFENRLFVDARQDSTKGELLTPEVAWPLYRLARRVSSWYYCSLEYQPTG
jgi:hypothetical protein